MKKIFNGIYFVLLVWFTLNLAACFGNLKAELTSFKPEEFKDSFYAYPGTYFIGIGQTRKIGFVNGSEPLSYRVIQGYGTVNELGEFTASAFGTSVVAATDSLGRIAYTQFDATDLPRFYPNEIKLITNEKIQLIAGGGRPPYNFYVESGNGAVDQASGQFVAPEASNDVVVRVVDVNGMESKARIYVRPPPSFANANVSMNAGKTIANSFSGGFGNLSLVALGVGISVNSSTGELNSGLNNGRSVVQIKDSLGNRDYQRVLISNGASGTGFKAEFNLKKMGANQTALLSVTGGTPPYSMSIKQGLGTISNSDLSFSTPETLDSDSTTQVEISDSTTPTARKVTIDVPLHSLSVTASAQTVAPGGTLDFTTTSALTGIIYRANRGSFVGNSYTAPKELGFDLVTVTDSAGNKKEFFITIQENPNISPDQFKVAVNSTIQIFTKELPQPISYKVVSGSALYDQRGYFKPTSSAEPLVVEAQSSDGKTYQATLLIGDDFMVTPEISKISASQNLDIYIKGGGLPYSGSLVGTSPVGTLSLQASNRFTYKAPANIYSETEQIIRLSDSIGNIRDVKVLIQPSLSLSISASALMLGESIEFDLFGGVPPYNIILDTQELGSVELLSQSKFKFTPTAVGSFSGVVVDSNNQELPFGPISVANTVATTATATISGAPTGTSNTISLNISVSGTGITHYRYKLGSSSLDCTISSDYSDSQLVATPITDSIESLADGSVKLCVIGKNSQLKWQNLSSATSTSWTKDTTAPVVTITSPVASSIVTGINQSNITLSGTCGESGLVVQVTAVANSTDTFSNTTTACTGGTFSKTFNLTAVADGSIQFSVYQTDSPGNIGKTKSVTIYKDTIAPTAPAAPEDGLFTGSTDLSPGLSWTASSDSGGLGIDYYLVSIGTSAGDTSVKNWTSVGNVTSTQMSGLSLQIGNTYYFNVKAVDKAGYESNVVSSDGWSVQAGEPLAIRFTDQLNANYSSIVTSASVTVSGISSARNVQVSGTGSPQVSTDGTNFSNSVIVSNNQTLFVRLTSAATGSTTHYALIDIGDYKAPKWLVTTQPSTVEFAVVSSTISESSIATNVNISISPQSPSSITLDLNVGGTSTAGSDHNLESKKITIPANTSSYSVSITPTPDTKVEGSETAILTLQNISGGSLGTQNIHTMTITDNNLPPLKISNFSPKFGISGGGYSLTLTGTGFVSGTTVKVGNNSCGTVNIVSETQMTCTVPAGTAGQNALVHLDRSGDTAQADASQYFYYSKTSATWSDVATSFAPTGSNAVGVWTGSKVVVWGGQKEGEFSNTGAMYDPVANSWTAMASTTLSPRAFANGIWATDRAYIFGGGNSSEKFSDFVSFHPVLNEWTYLGSAPIPGISHASMIFNDSKLYIFGGVSVDGPRSDLAIYDLVQKNWSLSTAANAPSARYAHIGQASTTGILIYGGRNQTSFLNSGAFYNFSSDSWTATPTSVARAFSSSVVTSSEVLVWGGVNESGALNSGVKYDFAGNSFTNISTTSSPEARVNHSAIWTGSRMIIFGGSTGLTSGNVMNSGGIYNPTNNTWSAMTSTLAPAPRMKHLGIWLDGVMFIWGGQNSATTNSLLTNGRVLDPGP